MSRRKRRLKNRMSIRKSKKDRLNKYDDINNIMSFSSLYDAAKKASKGVSWKASVQRYLLSILFKISQTRKEFFEGKDLRKGFIEFDICERGKTRHIKSVHFFERVVQKSICSNSLYPKLTNGIIYDNYASQKGKGTHFAENRLVEYLRWFYRKYKRNGYILLIDFKGYFENIEHLPVKETFRKHFSDINVIRLADSFVDAFGDKGLGLGSETSQINAIVHINKIDHYIKEVIRIKCYGRYMDDSFIIHQDKKFLEDLLKELKIKYSEFGVIINEKKTNIISLKHGFTFLKTRFYITETGKIIKKPCRESITKERRKLKKQQGLLEKAIITTQEVKQSYDAWKGSMKHRNSKRTVFNMDKLFNKIFKGEKK